MSLRALFCIIGFSCFCVLADAEEPTSPTVAAAGPHVGASTPEGHGLIYLFRKGSGGYAWFWNFLDDQFVGATKRKSYLLFSVPEGQHVLWTRTLNNIAAIEIEVEAGKTYHIAQREQVALLSGGTTWTKLRPPEDPSKIQKWLAKYRYRTGAEDDHQKAARIIQRDFAKAREQAAENDFRIGVKR